MHTQCLQEPPSPVHTQRLQEPSSPVHAQCLQATPPSDPHIRSSCSSPPDGTSEVLTIFACPQAHLPLLGREDRLVEQEQVGLSARPATRCPTVDQDTACVTFFP